MNVFSEVSKKVNKMSLRERILLFAVMLVIIYHMWQILLFEQLFGSKENMQKNVSLVRERIIKLKGQITDISQTIRKDPLLELTNRKNKLKKQNIDLEDNIAKLTKQLIPPKEMTALLGQILVKDKELTVLKMQNLPEKPIFNQNQVAEEKLEKFQVFQHGLEIEFTGTYFATQDFLSSLELLPWKILWQEISYDVQEYPHAKIKLVLQTLSLQQTWIGS